MTEKEYLTKCADINIRRAELSAMLSDLSAEEYRLQAEWYRSCEVTEEVKS